MTIVNYAIAGAVLPLPQFTYVNTQVPAVLAKRRVCLEHAVQQAYILGGGDNLSRHVEEDVGVWIRHRFARELDATV